MNVTTIRDNILAAKEKRAFLRSQYAAQGKATLSLSLNIPGYPKCDPRFSAFFDLVLSELRRFLLARRILIERDNETGITDEAGDFYLAPLSSNNRLALLEIKTQCERFEKRHPVGRVIDIDLTDRQGNPVSSGKLKACFLCEKPAIICMREQTHSYQELREQIIVCMANYLRRQQQVQICKQLAAMAIRATLYEVSVSPKPGLVDRFDRGAHQDMDYFTFLNSSAALAGYFEDFATLGWAFENDDFTQALPLIREVGLNMEADMFETTGGVNTQKGLIFLMGISVFAASYLIARGDNFQIPECRDVIAKICKDLVNSELRVSKKQDRTHGAHCFQYYGLRHGGARQEAEEGLPSVFDHGLPELQAQLSLFDKPVEAALMNSALVQTLLRLMSVVDDTNIIYRKGPATLHAMQQLAHHVLKARDQEARSSRYTELIDYCQQEGISPGGSADLLAVTVFFYCVESAFSP